MENRPSTMNWIYSILLGACLTAIGWLMKEIFALEEAKTKQEEVIRDLKEDVQKLTGDVDITREEVIRLQDNKKDKEYK